MARFLFFEKRILGKIRLAAPGSIHRATCGLSGPVPAPKTATGPGRRRQRDGREIVAGRHERSDGASAPGDDSGPAALRRFEQAGKLVACFLRPFLIIALSSWQQPYSTLEANRERVRGSFT
jgi:hypothetical protein